MYLTIASMLLAFSAGWCWGARRELSKASEGWLICTWCARFLLVAAVIFLAIGLSISCAALAAVETDARDSAYTVKSSGVI